MAKVIIFGTGQIAEIAHFYLVNDSPHEVVGFTVDGAYLSTTSFKNLPVVPFDVVERFFPTDKYKIFIPMSYKNVNRIRAEKYFIAKSKGYSFITYISSKAIYYGTPIGENCFIFENNVIQPFTEVGNNVIMWSGNHVGHHTRIKDHCFIASHVVISGSVIVEPYCFIGVNATIRDNITLGAESVIGAGSLILRSTPHKAVFSDGNSEMSKVTSDRLKGI